MKNFSTFDQAVKEAPQSSYSYISSQIAALITRFNLQDSRGQILQTCAEICQESLAFPYGSRPPNQSRINQDGTPLQYAVTLGASHPTLQFLGEAGGPGIAGAERMHLNRQCITSLAQRFQSQGALASAAGLLDALAPDTNIDLLTDPGGAYWIGAAFTAAHTPRLRIYINARWGKEQDRWSRLNRFAEYFGQLQQWKDAANSLMYDLEPLGTAITFNGEKSPGGRIYLTTYGKRMSFYEDLADRYGSGNFIHQLREFSRTMLGADYAYPTQTAVCSFGFGENPSLDFKFELCAHCLFASDEEASTRLRSWFDIARLDASDYWAMLGILSEGPLSSQALDLHSYVGIGQRGSQAYATIYFKPRLHTS